jgi:diguanylate cyclase (GGDEF)-like protein
MASPSAPADETRRLAATRALNLLDTPAETRFDRLTRLAARLFKAPMAVIALVDADRVWVKSGYGTTVRAVTREASFANAAIEAEEMLVVADTARDARFGGNPLVTAEPAVRFCAAVPLRAPDGFRVGALLVFAHRTRRLGAEEREILRDLGDLAEQELMPERMSPVQNDIVTERKAETRSELIDPVTRAWSPASIRDFLGRELARASRQQNPTGVIRVDVDGLDRIRKGGGAEAVDELLHVAARRIRTALRPYDAVGRFSDDGFLLILPGSDALNTMGAADRLQKQVTEKPVTVAGKGCPMTLSIGVAAGESPGRADVEALVRAVTGALTQARKGGGNRIELSGTRL